MAHAHATSGPHTLPKQDSSCGQQERLAGSGWGKATVAQAPSAASITPSLALSPPLQSPWVAWLVTHQAPPASDQERAAVAFPGGLDGGSEARMLTMGTIRSVHLGAQEFQWRCLRDWQVGWG